MAELPGEQGSGPAADSSASELPGVERLLALSDGVVAIALTLLVLQLAVPVFVHHHDAAWKLADELGKEGDRFLAYAISFFVIAQFWLAHHRVFRHVSGHHEGLAWWNFAFLFTITLLPFTSALLGSYGSNPLAVDIFAANLLLASLSTQAVVVYGRERGLLRPDTKAETLRAGTARAAALAVTVVASAVVAWWSTAAASYIWILLFVTPRLAARWSERTTLQPGPA